MREAVALVVLSICTFGLRWIPSDLSAQYAPTVLHTPALVASIFGKKKAKAQQTRKTYALALFKESLEAYMYVNSGWIG